MAGRSHDHTMNISIKAIASGISQVNKELTQITSAVKGADGKNVGIKVSLSGDAEKQIQSLITSVGNIEKAMNSINTRGITSLADAGSTASKSMTDLQSQIGAVNKSLDSINARNLTSIGEEAGNVSKSFMDATSSAGAFSSALDGLSAGNLADIASEVGNVADEFERATSNASAFADVSSSAKFSGGGSGGSYSYGGMPNWSNSYGGRYGGLRYTGQEIGLSDIVSSISGGKSPYELTVENALTKQRNKAILSAWPSETGDPTAQMRAYNAFDEATNNSLMSLNALAGGANAFRATANASAEEMEKYAPILADFGGYVMGLGYSEDVAQTAVMKLARGLGGAFTALDQYGITKKSLMNTGYWSGDENDLEGYMMAVQAISGDAMTAIKGTSEYGMKYLSKQASLGGYALGEIEMSLLGPLAGSYGGLDHWLLQKTKDMGLGAKILDAEGNETYRTTEDGREVVSTTGFNVSSIIIGASQITQGYRTAKDTILAFVAEYKDLKRLKKYGLKGIFSDYRYDMYGNGSWIPTQHELIKEMEKNQPKQIKGPCPDMSDCPGMNGNGGTKNNKKKKSSNKNKSGSKKKKSNKKKTINKFSPEITGGLNLLDPNNGLDYKKMYHDKEFGRVRKQENKRHNYEGLNSRVKNRKAITNDVNTPAFYRMKDLFGYQTGDYGKYKTYKSDTPTNIKMRRGSSSAIMTGISHSNRHRAENIRSPNGYKYRPQIGDYMPEVKSGNKVGFRNKNKNRIIPDWFYKGVEQELPKKYGGIKNGKAINKIGESYIGKKTKRRQIKSKRANNQILGAKGKQNVANFFKEQDNIMKEYKNSKKTKRGRYANKYGGYQKRTLGAIYDVKDLKKRGKSYINAKKQLLNQEFNNMKTNSARMGAEYTQKGRQLPYTAWNRGKTKFSNLSSAVNDKLSNSFLGTQYGALKRQRATVKSSITSSKPYQQIRGNSLALGSMMASTSWGQKITNSRLGKGISSVRQQGVGAVAGKKFSGLRAGISGAGGKVLSGMSNGVGAMAGGIGKIGGAISGIGMGFMSILGPIGAVVGGIMLLTSLLDMMGIDWLSPLQTAFGGLWDSLQPVIGGFNEWLQGVAQDIGPMMTQFGEALAPVLQTIGGLLSGGLGALAEVLGPVLGGIASLFSGDGAGGLSDGLGGVADALGQLGPIAQNLWSAMGQGAEGMGNFLGGIFDGIGMYITHIIQEWANTISMFWTTIGTGISNSISMVYSSIINGITGTANAISNGILSIGVASSNAISMISGAIINSIVGWFTAISGGITMVSNSISGGISAIGGNIISVITGFSNAVIMGITGLATAITGGILMISTAILQSFTGFATVVAGATATAYLILLGFQGTAVSLMGTIATDMVNAFKNNFTGIDAKVDAEMRGAYNTLSVWGDLLVAKCEEIGDRMQNALIHLGIGAGSPGKIWTGVDDEFRGTHGAMMSRGASLVRGALNIGKGVANSFRQSYNSKDIGYVPEVHEPRPPTSYNIAPVSPDIGLPKVTEPKLFKQLRDNKQVEKQPPVINFYHTGYLGDEEMVKSAMKYFVNQMDFENKRANRTV